MVLNVENSIIWNLQKLEDRNSAKHIKLEVQIQIDQKYGYGTNDWDIFHLDILENYNRIFLT